MPDHDISDKLAVRLLPKVVILVASEKEEIRASAASQTYPKCTVVVMDPGEHVPAFYNRKIAELRSKADIFIFLNDMQWFTTPDSVNRLVEEFVESDMAFAGIYTDTLRLDSGHLIKEFLPAFDPALLQQGRVLINNTIAVQTKHLPTTLFNEKLNHLYFFYAINLLGSRFILNHLAEPLFTIIRHQFDVQAEMNNFQ
jgi:hypothetical protein